MFTEIWAAIVIIILLISIGWNMIKRDRSALKRIAAKTVTKNFEQLAPLYKVNFLINKVFELQKLNLCPCNVKLNSLRNRLKKVQDIKEKLVLQNYDEQCKCDEAILWLERPAKKIR